MVLYSDSGPLCQPLKTTAGTSVDLFWLQVEIVWVFFSFLRNYIRHSVEKLRPASTPALL